MNARVAVTATVFAAFSGVLTAKAADSQLLSLVMPDAKVLAGANVDQAKATPFGLFVLTQIQSNAKDSQELQTLIAMTGFDPTRDVHELLAASNNPGPQSHQGLFLARGNFDPTRITTLATGHGALTEQYGGATIIEDPKQTAGIVFLDSTLVVAGDVASVKGAIDRPHSGQALPAPVVNQVNQWSNSEDAWAITTVPPSSFHPPAGSVNATGMQAGMLQMFQQVQNVAGGVKFGSTVTAKIQGQTDTAQNAQTMSDALKLLLNLAMMQAQKDPQVANMAQAVSISAQGTSVNVTVTLPAAQLQQLITQGKSAVSARPARPAMPRK